jgi:predicted nucleic acid-binding protein
MSVNYAIQAEVIDLRSDRPQSSDSFLVDTNVWYWLTYSRASQSGHPPKSYQLNRYPAYMGKAQSANAKLLHCGLSLAELAHLIEKTEREIFNRASGLSISNKEYRHNYPTQRTTRVVAKVERAWERVKAISDPLNLSVDESTTNAALVRFKTQLLDGYDLFILESMTRAGIFQVITDDGDFATVPGIQVFTANQNVITAAGNQGKLLRR